MITSNGWRRRCVLVTVVAGLLGSPGGSVVAGAQLLILLPDAPVLSRGLGTTVRVSCKSSDESVVAQNINWYSPQVYFPSESEPTLIKSQDAMPSGPGGGSPRIYSVYDTLGGSRELHMSNIQASDAGVYVCKARVGDIAAERNFTLQTFEPVSVTASARQFLVEGSEFGEIKCSIRGMPPPIVTWKKDGVGLRLTREKYEVRPTGLTIFNPGSSDKGNYTCDAHSTLTGEVVAVDVDVDIYTRPTFVQPPWLKSPKGYGVLNGDIDLGCNGTGYPAPQYSWHLGSEIATRREITPKYGTRFLPNDTSGDLSIFELRLDDKGFYWCRLSNPAGAVLSKVYLNVLEIPYFSRIQNSTREQEGGSAVIACQSLALPVANMTITKWGSDRPYVEGAQPDDGRIVVSLHNADPPEDEPLLEGKEIRMRISGLKPSDMSNYTCRASNMADSKETTLELRVNFKPVILEDSHVVYSWEGKRSNLTCRANAWPQPQFLWTYMDKPVTNGDVYKIYDGWMSSTLEIAVPMVSGDRSLWGTYTCVASNQQGSSPQPIDFREAQVPDQPVNLIMSMATATSITLSASLPEFSGGIPPIKVEVLPRVVNGTEAATPRPFEIDAIHRMVVRHLYPATEYDMRVSVRNERGLGHAASLHVWTLQPSKPGPVLVRSANSSTSASSYTLLWDRPDDGGLSILDYNIKWRKAEDEADWQSVKVEKSLTIYEIQGLSKQTTYQLHVLARNSLGTSDETVAPFIFITAANDDDTDIPGSVNDPARVIRNSLEGHFIIIIGVAVGSAIFLVVIDVIFCRTKRCGFFMCMYKACCLRKPARSPSKHDPDASLPLTGVSAKSHNYHSSASRASVPQQAHDDVCERLDDQGVTRSEDIQKRPLMSREEPDLPVKVFAPSRDPDDREPGETNIDEAFIGTAAPGSSTA